MSTPDGTISQKSNGNDGSTKRHRSLINALLNPYNFHLLHTNENVQIIRRSVHLLDDRCVTVEFNCKTMGRQLLRELCTYLGVLNSASYLGIRYVDNRELMQWLNLDGKALKQLKDVKEQILSLRVMYYPPNPLTEFKDPKSKHLFYLQLRRDFYVGRLRTNRAATCELAAYAIQAEHGLTAIPEGFDVVHIPGGMRILANMPNEIVRYIQHQLKNLLGLSKSEAKNEFIRRASEVETYGMEPFQVMDQYGNGLCIGLNYMGVSAFKSGCRTDIFPWTKISQVKHAKKQLIIIVSRNKGDVRLGFRCRSNAEAKMLWKRAANCAQFSRQIGRRGLLGLELCASLDQNGHESTAAAHCVLNSQATVDHSSAASSDISSSASQSDEEDDFSKRKEASQPALHHHLPVPRYSIAAPSTTHELSSTKIHSTPRHICGSMDLTVESSRGGLLPIPPQAVAILDPSQKTCCFTGSSINLPGGEYC